MIKSQREFREFKLIENKYLVMIKNEYKKSWNYKEIQWRSKYLIWIAIKEIKEESYFNNKRTNSLLRL